MNSYRMTDPLSSSTVSGQLLGKKKNGGAAGMNTIDFWLNLFAFGNDENQLGFGSDVRSQCTGGPSIKKQVRISRPAAKSSIWDP